MYKGNFPLVCLFFSLHPVIVSSTRDLLQNSDPVQLCFDLSSAKHGRFGRQTVEVTNANAQWFRGHDEVSEGPCDVTESSEELNNREMKPVTYCKHYGKAKNGQEYEIKAPRFLDNYLSNKGAGQGECMNPVSDDAGSSVRQSGHTSMDALCFDLQGYGKQTIGVDTESGNWFLRDGDVVTRGPCKRGGKDLDDRETEMVTYCKHFGSIKDGYEFEIKAPRFLSDHLHDKKGAERGECSDSDAGKILAHFVPEFFAPVMGDIEESNNTPNPKPNNESEPQQFSGKLSRSNNESKPQQFSGKLSRSNNESKPQQFSAKLSPLKNESKPQQFKGRLSRSNNDMVCTCVEKKKKKPNKSKPDNKKPNNKKPGNKKPSKKKPSKKKPGRSKSSSTSTSSTSTSSSSSSKSGKSKSGKVGRKGPRTPNSKNNLKPYRDKNQSSNNNNQGSKMSPESSESSDPCSNSICKNIHNGYIQRPNTRCKEYVVCQNGCVAQEHSCGAGLIFDSTAKMCNWEVSSTCSDPVSRRNNNQSHNRSHNHSHSHSHD